MTARIFITDKALYPLQMKLYEIIVQSTDTRDAKHRNGCGRKYNQRCPTCYNRGHNDSNSDYLSITPKHFIAGMMVGAVKE